MQVDAPVRLEHAPSSISGSSLGNAGIPGDTPNPRRKVQGCVAGPWPGRWMRNVAVWTGQDWLCPVAACREGRKIRDSQIRNEKKTLELADIERSSE